MSLDTHDKPFWQILNIDMIFRVFDKTFLNPLFAFLAPLTYRAQGFAYHHAPMYWSIVYVAFTAVLFIVRQINWKLGNPKKRDFDWTNEVVVITGGSSGLGMLIAEVYGMRGVSVAALDVRAPEGGETFNVEYYKCDVGDKKQVKEVAERIRKELGTPTILINNAGVCQGKSILELSVEEIEDTFKTNTLACFYTVKEFLPGMIKEGRGSIVSVASVLAHIGPKKLSDYAASKAALRQMHSSMTADLAEYKGIQTLLVTPGQLSTPMFAGVKTPSSFLAPVLEPVDVAKEIITAIDAGYTGEVSMPLYGQYLPLLYVLPVSLQRLVRYLSGCDRGMDTFVGRKGLKELEDEEEE